MANDFGYQAQALGAALVRAITPLLTPHLFAGAAVAALAGLGLGLWLKPSPVEMMNRGETAPVTMTAAQDDSGAWPQAPTYQAPPSQAPIVEAQLEQPRDAATEPEPVSEARSDPPSRQEDAEPREGEVASPVGE